MSPEPAPGRGARLLVVAALVWLDEQLLVQRRGQGSGHGAGMLELPGGKVERGEDPREALTRELREEWGPRADELCVGGVAEVTHHVYPPPGPELVLIVFRVDARAWAGGRWRERIVLEAGASVHALDPLRLPVDEFLDADRALLAEVREGGHRLRRLSLRELRC